MNIKFKYILIIPAFFIGSLAGWIFLGALPGIILTELWYGSESFRHPELIGFLGRPSMLSGGIFGAVAAFVMTAKNIR